MKTKEFVSLGRKLLPEFPGMIVHGPMMLFTPVGQPVLRGLCFEGSSFDAKSFYVWAFWMPLYVPANYISFNFGKRLRDQSGADRWDATDPFLMENLANAIQSQAIPFLRVLETPQDVVHRARLAIAGSNNPYFHEALAYALARTGKTAEAVGAIDTLLALLNSAIPWQAELGARANLLKTKLLAKAEESETLLDDWQAESIRALGFDKIV